LAAIALPQYETAVEKTRMSEALGNIKTLAMAQQRNALASGGYTNYNVDALDVTLPGTLTSNKNYVITKNFSYAINSGAPFIIYAIRNGDWSTYYFSLFLPGQNLTCTPGSNATPIQTKLCNAINSAK
jgi:type II secretory pathway pseudopilin PulG